MCGYWYGRSVHRYCTAVLHYWYSYLLHLPLHEIIVQAKIRYGQCQDMQENVGDTPCGIICGCACTLCVGAIQSSAVWRDWSMVLDQIFQRDCSEIKGSFWEQMGIWYIPFGIAAFFSFFAITLFLAGLCHSMAQFKKRKGQKKGEACLLIAFLCTYCLLFLVEIVCHSIAERVKVDHFTVWMLYALSPPLSGVMLPIGLLIYTYTGTLREVAKEYCKCHCIRRRTWFITLFRDPSSFTRAPTVYRSSDFVRLSNGAEDMSVQLPMPHERTGLINHASD